jgi:hypothetical protein
MIFLWFSMDFLSFSKTHVLFKKLILLRSLETFDSLQICHRFILKTLERFQTLQSGPWPKGGGAAGAIPASSPVLPAGQGREIGPWPPGAWFRVLDGSGRRPARGLGGARRRWPLELALRRDGGAAWATRDTGRSYVSVRNVVPTLTSDERQGLSLNGRC